MKRLLLMLMFILFSFTLTYALNVDTHLIFTNTTDRFIQIKNDTSEGAISIKPGNTKPSITQYGIDYSRDGNTWAQGDIYIDFGGRANTGEFYVRHYNPDLASPCVTKMRINTSDVFFNSIVTATGYACSSDARFKHHITPVQQALQKIMSLRGINYDWKVDTYRDKGFSKDRQIGLIAQDVEKVLPELVSSDSEGFKSIHYDKLTAVLVEAMKELNAKNLALEKENALLRERLASLEKISERVARLETLMQRDRTLASR
jgi:hypothetical protein